MAIYCDGSAGISSATPAMTATNNLTMMAWAYLPDATDGGGIFKLGGATDGYGLGHGNTQWDNNGSNMVSIVAGAAWLPSGSDIGTGTWKHLTLVRDSGTWKQYINAVQTPTTDTTAPLGSPTETNIGVETGGTRFGKARIAEARSWDVVLTPEQIANEMISSQPQHKFSNLKFWSPLDNAVSPTTYTDFIGGLTLSKTGTPTVIDHPPI